MFPESTPITGSDASSAPARIDVLLVEDHETVREGLMLLIDSQTDMRVVGAAADGRGILDQVLDRGLDHFLAADEPQLDGAVHHD